MILIALAAASGAPAQSDGSEPRAAPRVPEKYSTRAGGRDALDDERVARAIELGLGWLAKHQSEDGRWDVDGFPALDVEGEPCDGTGRRLFDVGVSGLCLLAFLADGSSPNGGPHADVVARGVSWLCAQQDPKTGRVGRPLVPESSYEHLIGTLAIVEAYGLSGDDALRQSAEAAVRFLALQRSESGGWRYERADGDSDTSATGWAAMALQAASDFGIEVDDADLYAALTWFDAMTDPVSGRTGYDQRGGWGARRPGAHGDRFPREASEALTAIAMECRFVLGWTPRRHPIMRRQAELILRKRPKWDEDSGCIDLYYWNHATHAIWQLGGEDWTRWWSAVCTALLPHQRRDGNFAGSWDPVCVWGPDGGRLYATAMAVTTLQVPYRFARESELCPVPEREAFAGLREAWTARRFDRVAELLERFDERGLSLRDQRELAAVRRAFEDGVADAVDEVAALRRSRDYHAADRRLTAIETEFAGLPPAEAAERILDSYRKDREIQREIRGGDELERLLAKFDPEESDQRLKLIRALRRMAVGRYADTQAAARAEQIIEKLERR